MMMVIEFSGHAEMGKDSSCNILKEKLESKGKKVLILHMADYLKYICRQYFEWNGIKDKNGRDILQKIGTNIVRKRYPDFWVETIINFIYVFQFDFDYFLVGDCRFKNEIVLMKNNFPTIAVRVNRPNHENSLTPEQRLHPSETSLDDFIFDHEIVTEEGLDNLARHIDAFIEKYNL